MFDFFRNSDGLHLHQGGVSDPIAVVSLIDRFIDGSLNYPLEWDDFISWTNQNASIENVRIRIASMEALAFSVKSDDRKAFVHNLIIERNKIARSIGLGIRED